MGPRGGRGEGMEKGHRPVGEQAIELMDIPRTRACLMLVAARVGPRVDG